ncbi:MAG: glycosyltransferase family 2 protein [Eubacteriales bacterium]|nr:glycosyltransferase family 2 protein [Eubacteriales bacterium]
MNGIVILIPSYKPDEMLCSTTQALRDAGFEDIYVVNDGSAPEYRPYFEQAAAQGCTVLHHARNQGKGRALRLGFNQILLDHPDCVGIVTCDADGQHEISAVLRAAQLQLEHPDAVILGARQFFKAKVPLPNLMGNTITRFVFYLLCGLRFGDTQCGLRSFPTAHMDTFLATAGNRFEFENMMLLELRKFSIPYVEFPMKAVYEEVKRVTHFNKLLDSVRIYSMLLSFAVLPIAAGALASLVFSVTTGGALAAGLSLLLGWVVMALGCGRRKYWALLCGALSGVLGALGIYVLTSLCGFSPLGAWWTCALLLMILNYSMFLELRCGTKPSRTKLGE